MMREYGDGRFVRDTFLVDTVQEHRQSWSLSPSPSPFSAVRRGAVLKHRVFSPVRLPLGRLAGPFSTLSLFFPLSPFPLFSHFVSSHLVVKSSFLSPKRRAGPSRAAPFSTVPSRPPSNAGIEATLIFLPVLSRDFERGTVSTGHVLVLDLVLVLCGERRASAVLRAVRF